MSRHRASPSSLLFVGSLLGKERRLRNPIALERGVACETWCDGFTRVYEIEPGQPARELAVLTDGHRDGCLVAADDEGLVFRRLDDTLAVLSRDDGRVAPLCRLEPAPAAIAVTPEYVVWCSARNKAAAGRVLRWWRERDTIEELGTHHSTHPLLAVRPVSRPYPPERIAMDVAIAAGQAVGLIDVEGIEWLARAEKPIRHLACTRDSIVHSSGRHVTCLDLDTESQRELGHRDDPVAAIAVRDPWVYIAWNQDEMTPAEIWRVELSGLSRHEQSVREHRYADRGHRTLAPSPNGVVLVEAFARLDNGSGDTDRMTYLPDDPLRAEPSETLRIQRWLRNGNGGDLTITGDRWWFATATGVVDRDTMERINRWIVANRELSNGDTQVPNHRGWQASAGSLVWYCDSYETTTRTASALRALVAALRPVIPPLAALAALTNP